MLYYAKPGDTLEAIALRVNTTVLTLLEANVICNPNLISIGQAIFIPETGVTYQKAGGYPYYIIQNGDSYQCIAHNFGQTVSELVTANQISNPSQISVDRELLVKFPVPNPYQLLKIWVENANNEQCHTMTSLKEHGIYYIGTFQWEALGEKGVPFLVSLLNHSCDVVRFYSVISLGRISKGSRTESALKDALNHWDPQIVKLAKFGLRRFTLTQRYSSRLHITINSTQNLYSEPNIDSPSVPLSEGTEVISLRWNIPSVNTEDVIPGGLPYYDQVQVVKSGKVGYLSRAGYNDIRLI